jgi:hypothetical protein
MENNFDKIVNNVEDSIYITISTEELTLKIIPFYSLPVKKIAKLYSQRKNQQKFIKEIFSLIHISMENPELFKQTVYDTSLSYTGLIQFLNTWITVSSMVQRYETKQINSDGTKTVKEALTNVDIIQNIIFNKLSKGEEVNSKLFIKYLTETIKETATEYNKTADEHDVITEITIKIPIGEELKYEF